MHNGEYSFDSAMLAAKMNERQYKSGATWHPAEPTDTRFLKKDGKYYAEANDLGQINRYTEENFDPVLKKFLMENNGELPEGYTVKILPDESIQYIDPNRGIAGMLKRRSS
jgi:hypothetical protein